MRASIESNSADRLSLLPSLWQKAWDSLDDELKAGASLSTNSGTSNIIDWVLSTANEKKQLCLRKRWKFRRSNGEEVVIRDVLEKIIC